MVDDGQDGEPFVVRKVGKLSVARLAARLVLFVLQMVAFSATTLRTAVPRPSALFYQTAPWRAKQRLTGKRTTADGHTDVRAKDISGLGRLSDLVMT